MAMISSSAFLKLNKGLARLFCVCWTGGVYPAFSTGAEIATSDIGCTDGVYCVVCAGGVYSACCTGAAIATSEMGWDTSPAPDGEDPPEIMAMISSSALLAL